MLSLLLCLCCLFCCRRILTPKSLFPSGERVKQLQMSPLAWSGVGGMQPLLQGSGSVTVGRVHIPVLQTAVQGLFQMAPPETEQIFKMADEIK